MFEEQAEKSMWVEPRGKGKTTLRSEQGSKYVEPLWPIAMWMILLTS